MTDLKPLATETAAAPPSPALRRQLRLRQISMLAIGGAIGTGLFLGSSLALSLAGPWAIVGYAAGAAIALVLVYAATEMTSTHPELNGFGALAGHYLGSFTAYVLRWMYWAVTVVTMGAEAVAVGVYLRYWWPAVPLWVPVLGAAAAVVAINLVSVRTLGTFEYWISMVKVSAIVAFLLVGLTFIFFGLPGHGPGGVSALTGAGSWDPPQGIASLGIALIIIMFSFGGVETLAVTGPESSDPHRDLPRAARWTIFRLALFYILSITVVIAVAGALGQQPTGDLATSPFVRLFAIIGLPAAAAVMNFVVLTAAFSALNTILYVAVRTIYSLGYDRQAPARVTRLSRRGVPANAVLFSAAGLIVAAVITILSPDTAFAQMLGIASFGGLTAWALILLTHVAFRRTLTPDQRAALPIRLAGGPWVSGLAALCVLAMVVSMLFIPIFQAAWIVGAPFVVLVALTYLAVHRRPDVG